MSERDVTWWDWVQKTKEKVVNQSSEVLEFVKKDIEEFSKVVTDEASCVVSSTATTIKEKLQLDDDNSSANQMKKSVSGFLSHVAEVFTPSPDDDDQEAILIWNQQPITLDRLQASKYTFCSNPSNFLKEPDNVEYETWLQTFSIDAHEIELPDILLENSALSTCYSTLVPSQISHSVFWHRYFYEIERLEKAEEKRKEMRKRAAEASEPDAAIVWEDDEEFGDKVVITEQMEKQLLEEYEKEIQEVDETVELSEPVESQNQKSTSKRNQATIITDEKYVLSNPESSHRSSKSSTPSSKDTEDEWEKVEPEPQMDETETDSTVTKKGEDWETWE